MGISMSWKAVIPSPPLEDGWGDSLDVHGVKSEPEVARNVAEVETCNLLEDVPLEQKNKPAEEVVVMELSAVCPREDKVMDMGALELQSGIDEQAEVGIFLKPAGFVGLDVGEDLPSMEKVKSGVLSSMETLKSGEVSPVSNKTGSSVVPSGSKKTPCPASASGKGKEVQQVYHTPYGETFRTPRHQPKKLRPKNNRDKGLDLVTMDGKVISPSKLQFQGFLVTEYNNVLLGLYKLGFKIKGLIELCEKDDKQKEVVFARAMRKASYSFDIGVVELLREAKNVDDFFEAVVKHLKKEFSKSRSFAWNIRMKVIKL